MDRPRTAATGKKRTAIAVAIIAAASLLLVASLRRGDPSLEKAGLVTDEVRRGEFVHEVAAPGSLVAEQTRLIAAPVAGRIEAIRVKPGDGLLAGDVIVELSNRETLRQLLEIEQQLAGAEADLADLEATLEVRSLESEKNVRRTRFEQLDAQRRAVASTELATQGLLSGLEAARERDAAEEVTGRVGSETERHAALMRSASAQMSAQRNRIERLRALQRFHRSVVDSLVVRTPGDTTVRDVAVQEGEWVAEGQRLIRLVEPGRLKAMLLVPEAAAQEVRIGQRVTMNARGVILAGAISRVGAAVENGTLAVEVELEGAIPAAARPDLSVDGRIELRRIKDALSMARPARAVAGGTSNVYRIDANGRTARRITIRYGPASLDRIVVIAGASTGDRFLIAGAEDRSEPVLKLQ